MTAAELYVVLVASFGARGMEDKRLFEGKLTSVDGGLSKSPLPGTRVINGDR